VAASVGWQQKNRQTDLNRCKTKDLFMGKGDKKTRRGKIKAGSYGKSRKHRVKKAAAPAKTTTKKKA